MKKLSLAIVLAVAALMMTGCRKSNVQPLSGGNGEPIGDYEMSLSAGNGDDDKSSIEGLEIHYQLGDKLHVVDATDGYLGYLTATSVSGTSGTFKGFITKPGVGHNCMFYFVGTNDFIPEDDSCVFDVSKQYGGLSVYVGNVVNDDYEPGGTWKDDDFNDISNGLQLMKNTNTITVDQTMLDAHNFGDQTVQMRSMMSIARLDLRVNGTSMGGELSDSVTVSGTGCYSTGKFNIKTGELRPVCGNIKLNKANGNYYMVVIPGTQEAEGSSLNLTFTATSKNNESISITQNVVANKFYNYNSDAKVVNMLPPRFSVADGRFVEFSKGNLYWDGTAFKMEKNQWDFQPTSDGTMVTNHVSHFFWSNTTDWQTHGMEPYAESYSYSTQTSGDSFFTNADEITPSGSFIVDGDTNTWRTLSYSEWNYVLNLSGSGRTDANRFAKAMVHNVRGLIVFPDGYTLPSGYNELGGTGMAQVNAVGVYYDPVEFPSESIPDVTWAAMESAGVAFLPAVGYREGTEVQNVGSVGYYWSSTPDYYEGLAYEMYFYSAEVNTNINSRFYGLGVRLVR